MQRLRFDVARLVLLNMYQHLNDRLVWPRYTNDILEPFIRIETFQLQKRLIRHLVNRNNTVKSQYHYLILILISAEEKPAVVVFLQ